MSLKLCLGVLSFLVLVSTISPLANADSGHASSILNPDFQFTPGNITVSGGIFPVREGIGECEVALASDDGNEDAVSTLRFLSQPNITSVKIQALIFRGDVWGQAVAEKLKNLLRQGVPVEIIVDAPSNLEFKTQWMLWDLIAYGALIEGWDIGYWQILSELANPKPSATVEQTGPSRWAKFKRLVKTFISIRPGFFNNRYHEKFIILNTTPSQAALDAVDFAQNLRGMRLSINPELSKPMARTGGKNIAREYMQIGYEREYHWRDQDTYVRGNIVKDLGASFDLNMRYMRQIKEDRILPFNGNYHQRTLQRIIGWIRNAPGVGWLHKTAVHFATKQDPKLVEWVRVLNRVAAEEPFQENFQPARGRHMTNRPRAGETYGLQAHLDLINTALLRAKVIYIPNAYFVPPQEIIDALKAQARKGLIIYILSNSLETNDLTELSIVARYLYSELLAVNDEIAASEELKALGGGIFIREWGHDKAEYYGTLHAKCLVSGICGTNSYNLDARSQNLNSESMFWFEFLKDETPEENGRRTLQKMVEKDWENGRNITMEEALTYRYPRTWLARRRLQLALLMRPFL